MVVGVGGGGYYSPHGNEAVEVEEDHLLLIRSTGQLIIAVVEEVVDLVILMDGLVVEVHQLDMDNLVSMVVDQCYYDPSQPRQWIWWMFWRIPRWCWRRILYWWSEWRWSLLYNLMVVRDIIMVW